MEPAVVWRRSARAGRSLPLVLLLHGRGADENDLIDLASDLPRTYAYAAIRGPLQLPEGGYRWFEDRGVGRPVGKSLDAAVTGVRAWLDGHAGADSPPARTYVLGFSAGMMVAGALLLADPARFAGGILLSGALALDTRAAPGRLTGLPVFVAHGTDDLVIPAALVAQTLHYLHERSGAVLTQRTYARGHSISRREIADIAAWLDERS